MTREEAIRWINNYLESRKDGRGDTEIDIALKMAIPALEQQPCEDCISRQAVLDLCNSKDVTYEVRHFKEDVECLPSIQPKSKTDVLDKIRAEIIELPTISFNANDVYKADVLQIIDKYKAESENKE